MVLKAAGPWEIDAMRMAYVVAEQWIRFGIDVKVETVDHTAFWSQPYLGYYDVWAGWCIRTGGVSFYVWSARSANLLPEYAKPIGEWAPNFIRLVDEKLAEILRKILAIPTITPEGELSKEYLDLSMDPIIYYLEKRIICQSRSRRNYQYLILTTGLDT